MKGSMLRRSVVLTTLCLGVSQSLLFVNEERLCAASAMDGQEVYAKPEAVGQIFTKDDVIVHAQKNFDKAKQEAKESKSKIDRVACTYKLDENVKLVESSTKVYYKDYRKRPDYSCQKDDTSTQEATTIYEVKLLSVNKKQAYLVQEQNNQRIKETVDLPNEFDI